MRLRSSFRLALAVCVAHTLSAQVVHVADLNTRQIRALDRSRTVFILQGGMLEEHGPNLPAFTNGILSARPTAELASGKEAFAAARRDGWPGYLGAPQLATATLEEKIWTAFVAATLRTTVEILDGKDPGGSPRYLTYLKTLPLYCEWIASANARDSIAGTRLSDWVARRPC